MVHRETILADSSTGPRTRAPLGMKTTNAKLKAFQTPAPLSGSAKTQKKTSPRLRRPKVKVHQAEPAKDDALEEEREIEYMPPRGIREFRYSNNNLRRLIAHSSP